MLADDSSKIFASFTQVVDQDQKNKMRVGMQSSVLLNKKDLDIINFWDQPTNK